MAAKGGADHDAARRQLAVAIAVADLGERDRLALARSQDQLALDQHVLDLAPIGAAVHADEAADGARNRAKELEAADPRVAGGRRDENAAGAAAAPQGRRIQ